MSEQFFLRAYAVDPGADEAGPIRFIASTEGVKRDGKDLKMEDWRTGNYASNPVVLWAHDFTGRNLPIGRATVGFEGRNMVADVTFDGGDPFAAQVERKYRRGFLNAVSVSWDDLKEDGRWVRDLLEISAVPVPADPSALATARQRGVQDLEAWLSEAETSDGDNGEALWRETAAAMVRCFTASTDDPDECRRQYNALLPAYRRAGRVAPEWMPADELQALGPEELRGLFLAGEAEMLPELFPVQEPSQRVGAVLSGRNRQRLEEAVALLREVLASAEREPEPEAPPEELPVDPMAESVQRMYLEFTRSLMRVKP